MFKNLKKILLITQYQVYMFYNFYLTTQNLKLNCIRELKFYIYLTCYYYCINKSLKFKLNYLFHAFFCSPYDFDTTGSQNQLLDYNDIHVLDFNPNLKTLSIMTVLENNIDQTCLPQDIR